MRKLLLSSVVLSLFAIALTVFQMSCQKEATAQQTGSNYTLPSATTSTLGGVIIGSGISVTSNGTISVNSTGGNYTLPPGTTSTLGGFIVGNGLSVTSNGTLSVTSSSSGGIQQLGKILFERYHDNSDNKIEYWTANYDGTNQVKIPITLPSGLTIGGNGARLTPDGQYLIFAVNGANTNYIYKCKLDGSGITKIVDNSTTDWYYSILGTY